MAAVFNEREASSRSACWFQRGRSVVVQRRAPGALRESSSPVPGDQSGRPGDGRLPFGAVRRAMPAVLASVQNRRWRRALPAVTQTYTESCRQGQDNFILGLFESGSVECRAGAPAPVGRPLRCAETPASGSGGVARRGCSERGPRSTSVYTCYLLTHNHQKSRAASAIEPPMQSRVDVAPTAFARDHRAAGQRVLRRLLARTGVVDDYFPRASQLSHRAVVPPSRARTRSEPPAKSGLPRSNAHSLILREPGSLVIILRA